MWHLGQVRGSWDFPGSLKDTQRATPKQTSPAWPLWEGESEELQEKVWSRLPTHDVPFISEQMPYGWCKTFSKIIHLAMPSLTSVTRTIMKNPSFGITIPHPNPSGILVSSQLVNLPWVCSFNSVSIMDYPWNRDGYPLCTELLSRQETLNVVSVPARSLQLSKWEWLLWLLAWPMCREKSLTLDGNW